MEDPQNELLSDIPEPALVAFNSATLMVLSFFEHVGREFHAFYKTSFGINRFVDNDGTEVSNKYTLTLETREPKQQVQIVLTLDPRLVVQEGKYELHKSGRFEFTDPHTGFATIVHVALPGPYSYVVRYYSERLPS